MSSNPEESPRLLGRARALADATDRWFVTLAGGVLAVGREAGVVALSTVRTLGAPSARPTREPELDLVSGEDGSQGSRHPAGVAPLLGALARIVAEHRKAGYSTLENDERFWTLVELLQALRRKASRG
jgi:hypothetical protein